MMTLNFAPLWRRTLPLALTALLLLATLLALTLAGTGLAGAEDNQLRVSVTANPPNPQVDVPVLFGAAICQRSRGRGARLPLGD